MARGGAASTATNGMVYSATYSNVPVYELNVGANHVMRRRSDSYINATHILKAADLDKPARTRVLEKEVQLGVHEKVQGGYGKYQGTWIPLASGVELARKYHVYNILEPIFEFTPGEHSPPPAPKHTTAASNRSRAPRASAARNAARQQAAALEASYDYPDNTSELPHEEESYDNTTIASQSMIDEDDAYQHGHTSSRKRKRGGENPEFSRKDQEHRIWADALLDYYVVSGSDPAHQMEYAPPPPPDGIDIDRLVDPEGHTALHWAAAMGDVEFVKDLLRRNANILAGNVRGETPLIKASIFANCYDKGTYQKMLSLLQDSLTQADRFGATILHHVAKSALNGSRASRARYYLEVLLNRLSDVLSKPDFFEFANRKDKEGDTAFHQAARASKRCSRAFQALGIPSDIPNAWGETVDKILGQRKERRARTTGSHAVIASSSPVAATSPMPFDSSPAARGGRFSDPLNILSTRSSQSFNKSLGNLVTTKINSFLQAGEDDLQDKDQLLSDTQAALNRAFSELAATQRECDDLLDVTERGDDVGALSELHAQLTREAEAYSEQLQHKFLHKSVRDRESVVNNAKKKSGNGILSDEDELITRIKAAKNLQLEQEKRKQLTLALVEAQAQAGMAETGETCLRVLESTLGIPKDQLYNMVDDLLEELEMSKKHYEEPVVEAD